MEPIALYAVAGAFGAAILLQVFVIQVWSKRTIHQVRGQTTTQHGTALPYIGHLLQLLIYGDGFLQRARDAASGNGRFSLQLLGHVYNIIYDPQTIAAVAKSDAPSMISDSTNLQIFENAFGLPSQPAALDAALKFSSSSMDAETRQTTTTALVRAFELHLPDLISYMSSLIDQSPWERDTIISVTEDHEVATVAFQELLRNFVTHHILIILLPPHLLETHAHAQTFVSDLWKVNAATLLLALDLPRWVPIPRLTTAHIARRNVLRTLTDLFYALDKLEADKEPAGEWQNIDIEDISPWLQDFQHSSKAASPEARASLLLARLLALTVQVTNLAFWMIAHLSADATLLQRLRDESKDEVQAEQPPADFGITEPVRLCLNSEGLQKCATLQAAYLETVRLYNRTFELRYVKENCSIADGDQSSSALRLGKGSCVVTAPWLYNTDASEFLHARKWWPERHMDVDSVDSGEVILPDGLAATLAGGEDMVRKVATAIVAGFVAIWDMKLEEGSPKLMRSVSVATPKGDAKATIRRRDVPSLGKAG